LERGIAWKGEFWTGRRENWKKGLERRNVEIGLRELIRGFEDSFLLMIAIE